MNKIGIYYAYWTKDWDADFVPYVAKVAALGFDILETNAGTVTQMSNSERDRLKDAAAKHKIELTYCIGLTRDYDIASADAAVRRNGIDFLKRQAQMVKYMGSKMLGGIIYSSWPGAMPAGETDRRPYLDRSVQSMKEVAKVVEDCGAQFNVEVVNRFEQYLMNTCEEGLDYVNRVGSPNIKVLLDTFHLNIEEDSVGGAIIQAGDNLGHVHLGETNRRAPGRGRIPWQEIVSALKKINYKGALVMEPFLSPGGQVGRDIRVYRDLSVGLDMDAEAKRAMEFMREQLR